MQTFNEAILYRRNQTLLYLASFMSIGSIMGLMGYLFINNQFTKVLFIGFAFSMIFHWVFYYLHNRTNTFSSHSKQLISLSISMIFTIIALYNPLGLTHMWIILLYFPIIVAMLSEEKIYKIWGTFYIIMFSSFMIFEHHQELFMKDTLFQVISQILFAIGSQMLGYLLVKHQAFVKSLKLQNKDEQMKEHIVEVLRSLVPIVESKTQTTKQEITEMSVLMKKIVKKLPGCEVKDWEIELLSLLHYVSRIQMPDYLFEKNEKLTDFEYQIVKTHCMFGSKLLGDFKSFEGVKVAFLKHHERLDGKGYPHGLEGSYIPQLAQVLGVVECYLALIQPRAYRRPMTIEDALLEIQDNEKTRVEPQILEAFIDVIKEIKFNNRKKAHVA